MSQKVKIWDLAVRFFHWSQVLLIAGLWYTGEEGMIALHQLLAYSLAALVVSRLVWGVIGSSTAKFSRFATTPVTAINYLRKPYPVTGHNPASFYMIVLLIVLVVLQLLSGLATLDNNYINDGPLVSLLPNYWVELASDFHKMNINVLLIAVAVHVFAALWHSARVHNVIWPLLTGKDKPLNKGIKLKNSAAFFVLFVFMLALLYWWQGSKLMAQL
ncbi:cytochrome b/b6 domain-containing protein [Rheinheimera metallidurans]|uniref:cytochrome b/b6 domain-containing protein n=1 Tax=Rheinheimera metallidurans TaxID=2925781 RepID=UPI00300270E2